MPTKDVAPELETLKRVEFFAVLTDSVLAELARQMVWKKYKKGERLFDEGEHAHSVFIIADGKVKVVKEFPSGKNAILGIFGIGGLVAEIAVIDKLPYPATAIAMDDCVVGALPADLFIIFLRNNPDALLEMVAGLGAKLRDLADNMGSMAVESVEKRLARFLLKFGDEIGKRTKEGLSYTLPVTRQDIAELIGTSFEVVERGLKKMKVNGLIKVDGKKIVILDSDGLFQVIEGSR
ncbi:MAG: Crp/Fnr family transcriptional regulator [Nitrospinota bacterium]|nr:Crp/Fnr family transcriptional regulator [Nitrospinota bacterium]